MRLALPRFSFCSHVGYIDQPCAPLFDACFTRNPIENESFSRQETRRCTQYIRVTATRPRSRRHRSDVLRGEDESRWWGITEFRRDFWPTSCGSNISRFTPRRDRCCVEDNGREYDGQVLPDWERSFSGKIFPKRRLELWWMTDWIAPKFSLVISTRPKWFFTAIIQILRHYR